MNVYLLIPLFFSASAFTQDFEFSPNRTPEQIQRLVELEKPWETRPGISPKFAFKAIKKLIDEDPASLAIYQRVADKLKSEGSLKVEDIIRFCEEGAGGGYFSQDQHIVDAQISLTPGTAKWSDTSLEIVKKSYTSKVMSVPFLDILFSFDPPTVCVDKKESIRSAYDILIHEFIHYLEIDQVETYRATVEAISFEEVFDIDMLRAGGEVDAYRAGVFAEARLMLKLGATNPSPKYPFLNRKGEVIDEKKFRDYVFWVYMHFYPDEESKKSALDNTRGFNVWRIEILEEYLATQNQNSEVSKQISGEIKRLKDITARVNGI